MVDLAQFEPHGQAAIKAIDLPADALKRAKEGEKWLDENAPPDWRLQMISIYNGKVVSRVRMPWNDQNPLALAFRHVDGFQGPDGRATWATVASRFEFGGNRYVAEQKGFIEKSHRVGSVSIFTHIDGLFLDEAWSVVLLNFEWSAQPALITAYGLAHVRSDNNMRGFGFFYPVWYKRAVAQARSA